MTRGWYFKFLLVLGLTVAAVWTLYPSYYFYYKATDEERNDNAKFCAALPAGFPCTKFNLGLDLQGGVHLVMGVQVEKAVEQRADRLSDALRDSLKEEKLAFTRLDRPRDSADIILTLAPDTDGAKVEKFLRRDFKVLQVVRRQGNVWTLALTDEEADFVRKTALDQAIKTIRNRADKLGVTEPTIAKRGTDNILIQLPGVKDPKRAIDLIGRTAQLEFRIVDTKASAVFKDIDTADLPPGVVRREKTISGPGDKPEQDVYFEVPEGERDTVADLLEPKIPGDRDVVFGRVDEGPAAAAAAAAGTDLKGGLWRTYVVHSRPGITGDYLTDAQVAQNRDLPSDYYVTMTFDPKGAQIFEKLTDEYTGYRMAIVLDGKVNSAPVIQEKIGGGTARITLGGAGNARNRFQEARDLVLVLKAGALPAPVEVREQREVGKTLGEEAVHKGSIAMIVGALLVVAFMLLYYRGSGVIADLALALNLLFLVAVLAVFEATLTLPGMAGIVLTLGMAVDANVIIFERIREEMRVGKTPRAAIEAGYGKAYSAIIDGNLTTLIAAIVLMQYGSGPVRGFAVTLIIGLICSLFTSVFCTRVVFDFFSGRKRLQSLSI